MDKNILPTTILPYETEPLSALYHLSEPKHSSVGPTPGCRCEDGRGWMRRSVVLAAGAELVSISINSLTCGPFSPWPILTLTRAPSGTPLCPAASSTRMCMNASDPPTTATNPKPFSALNHLTIASTGSDACGGALRLGLLGRLSATRSWGE